MSKTPGRAKRLYLIIPFVLFGLFFAAYTVIWFYGADIMEREVDEFIAEQKAMGNVIEFEGRKIKGYPFSLRTQLDNFTWADPDEWSWSGETLYIVTLPYDVSRLILAPRNGQQVSYQGKTYTVEGIVNIGLKEDEYSADGQDVTIQDESQSISFRTFRGNWRELDSESWELAAATRQAIYRDPDGQTVELPYWNLALAGTNEMDQFTVSMSDLTVTDGTDIPPTSLGTTGKINIDGLGLLTGQMDLKIKGEKALFNLAERYELAGTDEIAQVRTVLGALTSSGTKETSLSFRFADGKIYYGLIPLGTIGSIY